MMKIESYRGIRLTAYDLRPIQRNLASGIKSGSLTPVGTFETNDDAILWTERLINHSHGLFSLRCEPDGVVDVFMTRTERLVDRISPRDLRHAWGVDLLMVSDQGYLLFPDDSEAVALKIASSSETSGERWPNQSVEIQVDPAYRGQWVYLLTFGYHRGQKRLGDDDLLVIRRRDHQLLPRHLKFIPWNCLYG